MANRCHRALGAGCLGLLAACAEMPAPPVAPDTSSAPASVSDTEHARAIAHHRDQAQKYRQSGDLPAAAEQWHVVTLLAPGDQGAARELAATRAAIEQGAKENLAAGNAALRAGDGERAMAAMLRALAFDPGNAEAARAVREIERQKLARVQADRAAKVRQQDEALTYRGPRTPAQAADSGDGYDLEQRLELFRAGDVSGGLRELREYVDANPRDRAGRQRIGAAVYERARELESKGARADALAMYEQAVSLRGDAAPGWAASIASLRKSLSDEYFERGQRAFRTDLAAAIVNFEASLRYDPQNAKAALRLKEARTAQEKLKLISGEGAPR